MTAFKISHKANNSVWATYRLRNAINANPDYQRQGDVWTLEKMQLLIDTIFNQFDVPKIYLHKFPRPQEIEGKLYDYSIVDGKQRLTTIWDFIDGKFALADDFKYYADASVVMAGKTYKEIASNYPDIKSDFDSFQLALVEIEADEIDTIEEMFSRLNEAVTLNAPEKRNAYSGPIPKAIRDLGNTVFFLNKLAFTNKRFKHYDLATKFLYAAETGKTVDTKKVYLDKFVEKYEAQDRNLELPFVTHTLVILKDMFSGTKL